MDKTEISVHRVPVFPVGKLPVSKTAIAMLLLAMLVAAGLMLQPGLPIVLGAAMVGASAGIIAAILLAAQAPQRRGDADRTTRRSVVQA
jgi:hypothetical protein